jgi:hypothetical protein
VPRDPDTNGFVRQPLRTGHKKPHRSNDWNPFINNVTCFFDVPHYYIYYNILQQIAVSAGKFNYTEMACNFQEK